MSTRVSLEIQGVALTLKYEIRVSKSETNSKDEYLNFKQEVGELPGFGIEHLYFGFVSDFVFRISGFSFTASSMCRRDACTTIITRLPLGRVLGLRSLFYLSACRRDPRGPFRRTPAGV